MKTVKLLMNTIAVLAITGSVAHAASITGQIKYDGEVPKPKEIKMSTDPVCLTKHANPVFADSVVVSDDKALADVFIHVTSGLPSKEFETPGKPVVLDQKGCMYSPKVLGVMVNQPLQILNPDGTLHNVHGTPKINKKFNLAMPKFRKKMTRKFDKPEFMFQVKCDVHPWMGAWISVMEHPYFAVSNADGKFSIADLPAGEYEIEAWHAKLGSQKQKVVISDDAEASFDFTFKQP